MSFTKDVVLPLISQKRKIVHREERIAYPNNPSFCQV